MMWPRPPPNGERIHRLERIGKGAELMAVDGGRGRRPSVGAQDVESGDGRWVLSAVAVGDGR